jgi:photolyase PhrII
MIADLDLPEPTRDRIRPLNDRPAGRAGYVLAWPRASLRAEENPLLDVAIAAGARLGLPVFVVHALSRRYPYASARHHTFALEGHRSLAAGLRARGLASAFHLERPGHEGPHLHTLAAGAALVVTDDVPVRPLTTFAERLAARAPCPVWAVDTACVVPMNRIGRSFDRAFRFRDVHAPLRARYLARQPDLAAGRVTIPDLPFDPVDLAGADLAELVAACEVDPTVGPVPETPGGTEAGMRRFEAFLRSGGLARYARDRNDPTRDGTSRMSAYLHYGMVAAARLARDAEAVGGPGAEKWIDELLTWRELAWVWCRFGPDPHRLDALPAWARATLLRHAADPRPSLPTPEALARGQVGEPLWDAAQRSLLRHGELHNNLRMTWGKALIGWTPGPAAALDALVDLNHRYALDGRDPASYGGLLWCLGLFDRPFQPEVPILGAVRPRPVADHARRVDLPAYERQIARPLVADPPTVAIVGLGPAGALLARTLVDHGVPVVAIDKGRGPGGRLSTRRGDHGPIDHGAPGLGPLHPAIARYAAAWEAAGLLVPAPPTVRLARGAGGDVEITTAEEEDPALGLTWLPAPSTSALLRHLLADVPARFGAAVTRIVREDGRFVGIGDDGELFRADRLVVTAPGPQAAALLAEVSPALAARARAITPVATWVALVALPVALPVSWAIAVPDDPELGRIVRQSALPGRAPGERLALHLTDAASARWLEEPAEVVAQRALDALRRWVDVPEPLALSAHRWRYARGGPGLGAPVLVDGDVALAGDGVAGGGVAGALWSGAAAAGRILGALGRPG